MIKLIDLQGWQDYKTSPYINQLKQLSESPDITPTKREKQDKLPQIQQKKLECYEIKNQKSSYFTNRKYIANQVVSEERKSQKLKKQFTNVHQQQIIHQQQYSFCQLSSFIDSPTKSKKLKDLQNNLFQKRSFKLRVKDKILMLTQKSPLQNISQLINKLNSEDIDKNELLQNLDK